MTIGKSGWSSTLIPHLVRNSSVNPRALANSFKRGCVGFGLAAWVGVRLDLLTIA